MHGWGLEEDWRASLIVYAAPPRLLTRTTHDPQAQPPPSTMLFNRARDAIRPSRAGGRVSSDHVLNPHSARPRGASGPTQGPPRPNITRGGTAPTIPPAASERAAEVAAEELGADPVASHEEQVADRNLAVCLEPLRTGNSNTSNVNRSRSRQHALSPDVLHHPQ